jgi:uncharacterized small protein (DUF1192 family)
MTQIDDITFYPSGDMGLVSDSKYEYSYKASTRSLDTSLRHSPQLPTIVLALLVAELSDKVDALRNEIDVLKARQA